KNRLLVISAPHESDGYYRLMLSLLKPDVYCQMADRHMQQIIMFHGKEDMGGKVRLVNNNGSILEEQLDPALVPRLMSFLKLEEGKFGMALLRKTLQVEERYPYPVQLEAVYEIIDQTPMRRLEKTRQKGFVERDKHKDRTDKISPGPRRQKPIKDKLPRGKNLAREQINEHVEEQEAGPPPVCEPGETLLTTKTGKTPREKGEKKKKAERTEKPVKKNNTEKKVAKPSKDAEVNLHNRNVAQKASSLEDKDAVGKPAQKPVDTKRALETFLSYFEKRRRLLVITTPTENNKMYSQQRDEYLEQVCDMALRKVSIITIFGPLANGTMKIDHYQMEQDKPVRSLPVSELINQELITAFRKELGMVYNDFFMVLTDFDMKVKQQYEVPIIMKAVFDYIDTFSSRLQEMELQRKLGIACKKEDKSRTLENFLSRFRWRRRLLVISTPDEEEWAYQQQLHALTSQACNLGLRHMSVLKLAGRAMEDMGGVLELYPINGSATLEREDLSASLVHDIRNYFQVSADYFSMLLVGKDGNVKSWYPSPMWSMSIIYELIDSMQLRRQEMAIQQSLGMRCPEEYGHHEEYHEGYHRGYGY
ncbi:hypothetical protein QTP86_020910, partial [Hemibagrus guttatus]